MPPNTFSKITRIPGKDVRGILVDSFQEWLNIPTDKLEEIKTIITTLHNASLLIDDIEDNSKMRRGVPVAHSICKCEHFMSHLMIFAVILQLELLERLIARIMCTLSLLRNVFASTIQLRCKSLLQKCLISIVDKDKIFCGEINANVQQRKSIERWCWIRLVVCFDWLLG